MRPARQERGQERREAEREGGAGGEQEMEAEQQEGEQRPQPARHRQSRLQSLHLLRVLYQYTG